MLNIKAFSGKLVKMSSKLNLSPHYVNLVFEKNLGASPLPQYFPEKFFGFRKNIFEGAPKWEGAQIFYFTLPSPPNKKPLGTALKFRTTATLLENTEEQHIRMCCKCNLLTRISNFNYSAWLSFTIWKDTIRIFLFASWLKKGEM